MTSSFRGVPFAVRGFDLDVGQRRSIVELPFDSQGAASVDLGRRAREIRVAAVLIGPDRESRRERLLAAFEQPGPGLLVHPVFGTRMVIVSGTARLVESTELGGVTEVEFTAVESRDRATATPAQTPDRKNTTRTRAVQVRAAARADLVDTLSTTAAHDFVRAANLEVLDVIVADIRELHGLIGAALSVPGRFAAQIDSLSRGLTALIDTPGDLFDAIDGTLETLIGASTRVAGALGQDVDSSDPAALRVEADTAALVNLRASVSAGGSLGEDSDVPPDEASQTAREALTRANRAGALAHAADTAAQYTFASAEDARAMRDLLADSIDRVLIGVEDASLFGALMDLRAAIASQLSGIGLPRSITHTPAETTTALEIAHELYGDATRAGEITARNRIAHPLFVAGLEALEVLSV